MAVCGVCGAQSDPPPVAGPDTAVLPTEDSPSAADSAALPAQKPFFKKLFTLQAISATLPGAILQQVHDWPTEWGKKRSGFEKRAASLYGQFAIGLLIEDGVRAVHPEDTRYLRLGKGNFFRRTGHVIAGTLLARKPDGGRTFAFSLPANAYGSWAIATLWSPHEYRRPGSILEWGSAGMAMTPATNLFREFWPDIKGIFHKKKPAGS